jgi:hypothetical protein
MATRVWLDKTTHTGSAEKGAGGLRPEHGRRQINDSKSHLANGF